LRRGIATGFALTLCLLAAAAVGIVIGLLIYMIRKQTGFVEVDRAVAAWTDPKTTTLSIDVLRALTWLGATPAVVTLAGLTAGYAIWRFRSPSSPLFLALVIDGQLLLADLIKDVVQRARPDIHPYAGFTGPSFPSGHTTAAAATFVAIALVLGRDRTGRTRRLLAGLAVGLATAVACSRVFLGVHWLSDVIGGLLLGWTWVSICAVAFGGRVMRFGAPTQAHTIAPSERSLATSRAQPSRSAPVSGNRGSPDDLPDHALSAGRAHAVPITETRVDSG